MKLRNTSILLTIACLGLATNAFAVACQQTGGVGNITPTYGVGTVTQTLCYPLGAPGTQGTLSYTAPNGTTQSTPDLFTFLTFDPTLLGVGQVLQGIKITLTADFTATGSVTNNATGTAQFILDLEDHGKLCQPDTDPNLCFAPGFGVPGQIDDLATLIGLKLVEETVASGASVSDSLATAATGGGGSTGGGAAATHLTTTVTLIGTGAQKLGGAALPFVGTGLVGTYGSAPSGGNNAIYDVASGEVVVPVNFVAFSSTVGQPSTCTSLEQANGLNQPPTFNCGNTGNLVQTFTSTGAATVTVEYDYGSPVPEPGSLMLLGSGLTALAAAIRRKVAKS